jgi:hypothetical protein
MTARLFGRRHHTESTSSRPGASPGRQCRSTGSQGHRKPECPAAVREGHQIAAEELADRLCGRSIARHGDQPLDQHVMLDHFVVPEYVGPYHISWIAYQSGLLELSPGTTRPCCAVREHDIAGEEMPLQTITEAGYESVVTVRSSRVSTAAGRVVWPGLGTATT